MTAADTTPNTPPRQGDEPRAAFLCDDCHRKHLDWADYDRAPVRGWRNYPVRPAVDIETRARRLNERAELIREQCELIVRICRERHQSS